MREIKSNASTKQYVTQHSKNALVDFAELEETCQNVSKSTVIIVVRGDFLQGILPLFFSFLPVVPRVDEELIEIDPNGIRIFEIDFNGKNVIPVDFESIPDQFFFH